MNFDELPNLVEAFDEIMRDSLSPFCEELAATECYRHEHQMVNLFVFGHLVPQFQRCNLDLRQIGIEHPVRQIPHGISGKSRARKDLVIWPRVSVTLFNGFQPLAVVEWKRNSITAHQQDVRWLKTNTDLMQVGYACLVTRSESGLTLSCTRVEHGIESLFVDLPAVIPISGEALREHPV
jgi:hypothetical protein